MSKFEALVLDATAANHRPVAVGDQFDANTERMIAESVAAGSVSADAGNQIVLGADGKLMVPAAAAPTFLADTDTPAAYTGAAGKLVAVNAGETALEFIPVPPTGVSTDAGNQLVNGTDSKPFFTQTVTSFTYDPVTTTLSFVDEAGNTTTVNLAALTSDIFVNGAAFDPASLVLTLTDNGGATPDVTVNLASLLGFWKDNADGTYTYDAGNGSTFMMDLRAANLPYDDTVALMGAGTVQKALDSLDGRVDALEAAAPTGTPNTITYYDAAGAPTDIPLAPGYLNVAGIAQAPSFVPVPIPATVRRITRLQENRKTFGSAFAAITNFDEIVTAGTRTNSLMVAGDVDRGLPIVQPVGGLKTGQWAKVWASQYQLYAITTTGELWVKGYNASGQLGLGNTTVVNVLTKVPGVTVSDIAISNTINATTAGVAHYVIAWNNATGQAWGWGFNGTGQLGDGTTTQRNSPVALTIPGFTIANPIKQVELSGGSAPTPVQCSFVLLNDGALRFCGSGANGRLGNGATGNVLTWTASAQANVAKVFSNATHYSTTPAWESNGFSAILQAGTVKTTGVNTGGQLGDASVTQRTTWVTPAGAFQGSVADIGGAGGTYGSTWVLTTAKEVYQTGYNQNGRIGDNTVVNKTSFVKPAGAFQGNVVKVVSSALAHPGVLLIDTSGNAWYAGDGGEGQAGDGTNVAAQTTFQRVYLPIEGTGVTVVDAFQQNSATASTIYLLCSDGRVFSGGNNASGMLGIGEPTGMFYFFQEMKLQ